MSDIEKLEKAIQFSFSDKNFLDRALTRKAYALECKQRNESCEDQEIYRVLGDAVLKAVLVDLLIQSGCCSRQEITERKMEMESEEALAKLGRKFSLDLGIKLGAGEQKQNIERGSKTIAETLEAVVAAIYLDAGYETVKTVVAKWFDFSSFK